MAAMSFVCLELFLQARSALPKFEMGKLFDGEKLLRKLDAVLSEDLLESLEDV